MILRLPAPAVDRRQENRLLWLAAALALALHVAAGLIFSVSRAISADWAGPKQEQRPVEPKPEEPGTLVLVPPAFRSVNEADPLAPTDEHSRFQGAWNTTGSSDAPADPSARPGPATQGADLPIPDLVNAELGFGGTGSTLQEGRAPRDPASLPADPRQPAADPRPAASPASKNPTTPDLNPISTTQSNSLDLSLPEQFPATPDTPAASPANTTSTRPLLPEADEFQNAGSGPDSLQRRAVTLTGSFDARGRANFDIQATALGRYHAQVAEAIGKNWQRSVLRGSHRTGAGRVILSFEVRPSGEITGLHFDQRGPGGAAQELTLETVLDAEVPAMPPALTQEMQGRTLRCQFTFVFL